MSRCCYLAFITGAIALTACAADTNLPSAVAVSSDAVARSIYPDNAPNGTHFQAGTSASCSITDDAVSCSSYELAGVGNANAEAALSAHYSATVDCTNHGGKMVPVKSQVEGASVSTGELEPKNGRMKVPSLSTGAAPSDEQFENGATCPNGNWTKDVRSGSLAMESYQYTLTFVTFQAAYIVLP
ncbi:MAG: hypothetical protein V4617_05490 [Gemmatimonadota bacterium]